MKLHRLFRSKKYAAFALLSIVITLRRSISLEQLQASISRDEAPPILKDLVQPTDIVYKYGWDSGPVVIEEYKLLFFTVPKVGCTTFKQLFRRMMNKTDFMSQNWRKGLPHNPSRNGLKYLFNYTLEEANYMMTAPEYTRAIFVRDPKARFMSAYMEKGGNWNNFLGIHCCPKKNPKCLDKNYFTMLEFMDLMQNCSNTHWTPQYRRMEPKFWKYVNFVGHLETISDDGPRLLQKIGAEKYLRMGGWGEDDSARLFTKSNNQNHATNSSIHMGRLTPLLIQRLENYYQEDYDSTLFGFEK